MRSIFYETPTWIFVCMGRIIESWFGSFLDVCLGDLLREEQQLATQLSMTHENIPSTTVNVAYVAQGREKDIRQCFSCKGYGHIARNYPKKVCNYCKKAGYFLKDCRMRPQNRQSQAFQADVQPSSSGSPTSISTDSSVLTPAMVQQMILSAFTALGFRFARYRS